MKNLTLVLVVSFLVSACSSISQHEDTAGSIRYDISYNHYNYNQERISYQTEDELKLIFPSIPGLIFGSPTENILSVASIQSSKEFTLELPSYLDREADYLRESRLNISPADTKIIRLGTFHLYSNYQESIGGGGFIDTESGNNLLLVYFSKPSRVRGTLSLSGENYHHEIEISSAGWHWIEIKKISPKEYTLIEYTKSQESIDFMVLLNEGVRS